MPTAILIDGAYFIERFRIIEPQSAYDADRAAECAHAWACAHLLPPPQRNGTARRDLYRIFFYDCPPLEKKMHNPINGRAIDLSKSAEALFRNSLHARLLEKRKVAVRLGHWSADARWTIKPDAIDMRIGVDVASLAFKKQVDQIVLFAGHADFVPAAKQARREGIDFVLDPMWRSIPASRQDHIDGLRSTCPRPQRPAPQALA